MRRLSDKKIAAMYKAFCDKQTNSSVARRCNVNQATVRRYRELEKWDDRVDKIQSTVAKRVDVKQIDHKVRHAEIGQIMQAKGLEGLKVATGKDISPKVATSLLKEGVTIEKEALGDHAPNVVIVLELPEGMRL